MLARFSIRLVMLCWLCVAPGARAQEQAPVEPAEPVEVQPVTAPKAGKAKPMASKSKSHSRPSNPTVSLVGKLELIPFEHSPFPYNDIIPETGETRFLSNDEKGAFHLSPRGGKLYEAVTYSDRTSLLYIPKRFDLKHPNPTIILFLHGNLATLKRDVVERQKVPEQLEASGMNAVLVAPQLAVSALDSSAGRFWKSDFLEQYLDEAADKLAHLSSNKISAEQLRSLPVVVVAYSGGYLATAFSLKYDRQKTQPRIKGVILLDALFGEEPKFADWIAQPGQAAFFVSVYSDASRGLNAQLAKTLVDQQIQVASKIPNSIGPREVVFQAAPGADHNAFVTQAWVKNPLQEILWRIELGDRPRPAQETSTAGVDAAAPVTDVPPPTHDPRPKPKKASKPAPKALHTKSLDPAPCPEDGKDCKPGENRPR